MNFEEREIKTLEADFDTYDDWLKDNQLDIISEMLTAVEEMILEELDETVVVNINVVTPVGYVSQVFKMYREDIVSGLNKTMEKCIDLEAYEYCQRIKEILDYIKEEVDDLQLT